MATKKQKREAALARRETYLEEVRQSGLEALHLAQQVYAETLRQSEEKAKARRQGIALNVVDAENVSRKLNGNDLYRAIIEADLVEWAAEQKKRF